MVNSVSAASSVGPKTAQPAAASAPKPPNPFALFVKVSMHEACIVFSGVRLLLLQKIKKNYYIAFRLLK
jgi:hypothetical protein